MHHGAPVVAVFEYLNLVIRGINLQQSVLQTTHCKIGPSGIEEGMAIARGQIRAWKWLGMDGNYLFLPSAG